MSGFAFRVEGLGFLSRPSKEPKPDRETRKGALGP